MSRLKSFNTAVVDIAKTETNERMIAFLAQRLTAGMDEDCVEKLLTMAMKRKDVLHRWYATMVS